MSGFTDFIKQKIQSAKETFFDNSINGFVSNDVQAAIEEIQDTVITSASPGFSFGRSSNINTNTWLQCESVPSNKSGRYVYINSAEIKTVFISNETVATFDLSIYHHEGDGVNLTLLDTVSVVSSRGGSFTVSIACPTAVQLAIKVSSGSGKNMVCGLELSGTD